MNERTRALRDEHRELLERLQPVRRVAQQLPSLDRAERAAAIARVVGFLQHEVVPHTRIDERVLYPEVSLRAGDPLFTAPMNYDHLAIRRWVDEIEAADPSDTYRLQELVFGLLALIEVHTWKEDELLLVALESSSWPALQS